MPFWRSFAQTPDNKGQGRHRARPTVSSDDALKRPARSPASRSLLPRATAEFPAGVGLRSNSFSARHRHGLGAAVGGGGSTGGPRRIPFLRRQARLWPASVRGPSLGGSLPARLDPPAADPGQVVWVFLRLSHHHRGFRSGPADEETPARRHLRRTGRGRTCVWRGRADAFSRIALAPFGGGGLDALDRRTRGSPPWAARALAQPFGTRGSSGFRRLA